MAATGLQWYLWITLVAVFLFLILFAVEAFYWDKVYKQISTSGTTTAGVTLKEADIFRWLSGAAAVILFVHLIWTIEKLVGSYEAPKVVASKSIALQSATVPLVESAYTGFDELPYCD